MDRGIDRGQTFLDDMAERMRGATGGEYARTVKLLKASDVKIEPVEWIWNGWCY